MTESTPDHSLDAGYFDRLYARESDPWDFESSPYERHKYEATLAALGGLSFGRTLEIGCSIGVLTEMLAPRSERLLAVDISERALESARSRCAALANVRFAKLAVPREFPAGRFDLVVVSEVGYYWSRADLGSAIERIAAAAAGGTVELVHYLPKVEDYPLSGDEVHDAFLSDRRFVRRLGSRTERYRLDVLGVAL